MAWFAVGMGLWIGGTFGGRLWQTRAARRPAAVPQSPARSGAAQQLVHGDPRTACWRRTATARIRRSTISTGRRPRSAWSAPWIWARDDDRTLGKLALSRGYATLERLMGGQYSERRGHSAAQSARANFSRTPRTRCPRPGPAPGAGAAVRVLAAQRGEGHERVRRRPSGWARYWAGARLSSRAMPSGLRAAGGGAARKWKQADEGCRSARAAATSGSPVSTRRTAPARARWHSSRRCSRRRPEAAAVAVTKSWTLAGAAPVVGSRGARRAAAKLVWLVGASLLVAAGLGMVYAGQDRSAVSRARPGW